MRETLARHRLPIAGAAVIAALLAISLVNPISQTLFDSVVTLVGLVVVLAVAAGY